jgi:Asp-tRNA(Asn)/Glu-tRNA(Gln) amidotransferase A subunit family amidase
MSNSYYLLGAGEVIRHLRARDFTVTDYVQSCLEQLERWEPHVHAWARVDAALALRQAEECDRRIARNEPLGGLAGVVVGVKDIFNTADLPTQMGSPIWAGFRPGNDARVVHYLRQAGAILPGKTVTAEFAVHAPGPTGNPHNPAFMPGTSSSGSAAAVAAYMVPLALGTQTAGSTIRPASYCGIYGLKPSFGLIPRTGMLKTTDSLDTVGLFARSGKDLQLLFDTVRVDGLDYPISHQRLEESRRRAAAGGPRRVAVVRGPKWDNAEPYAQDALLRFAEKLRDVAGMAVAETSLPPSCADAHAIHQTIYDRSLAYYFQEEFKKRTLLSGIMYETIERGNRVTLAQFQDALRRQASVARQLDHFFAQGCDAILTLSTGGEALEGLASVDRPDNCLVWTLCGVPSINLPVFRGPNGLPFGAQLVARRYGDPALLQMVDALRQRGLAPTKTYPDVHLPLPAWTKSRAA